MLLGWNSYGVPGFAAPSAGNQVLNPTSDTYEFHWTPEESDKRETEDPFRCLTKPCPQNRSCLAAQPFRVIPPPGLLRP